MMLRHDDISYRVCLLARHVSMRAHTKTDNFPKNTSYVTPSPPYLEAPSLPEPSTALMF